MELDSEQLVEALQNSITRLLVKRIKKVANDSFSQALATNKDMAQIEQWASKAQGVLNAAAWKECQELIETAEIEAAAAKKLGVEQAAETVAATSAAASESAKKTITSELSVLNPNSFYLKTEGEQFRQITDAWRAVQEQAARSSLSSVEFLNNETVAALAQGAVGISTGGGQVREITGAVRQAAYEAKAIAADNFNREVALSVGMDAVQISAHAGCADDHLPYQGKVYTLTEMELVQASLSRPIGLGIMNCRHSLHYCYAGSSSVYSQSDLAKLNAMSVEEVSYTGISGKKLTGTRYDATQYMRTVERSIRTSKQQVALCKIAGKDALRAETAVSKKTKAYQKLCRELGQTYNERRLIAYTVEGNIT